MLAPFCEIVWKPAYSQFYNNIINLLDSEHFQLNKQIV